MRNVAVAGFLSLSLLLSGCCICKKSSDRPQALFNGKDLSNWRAVSEKPGTTREQVWSVQDGIIVCKGEPMGYIETDQQFTNFKLHVDYRWAPGQKPGNSGIFLRINGQPRPLPRCIECQLKSGDAGDLYGFHGMQISGDPARKVEVKGHQLGGDFAGVKKISGNEKSPGEWNQVEIVANEGNLTVTVNGQQVNQAVNAEVISGPVGLQSEGGEIHFRNVRIQPLGR